MITFIKAKNIQCFFCQFTRCLIRAYLQTCCTYDNVPCCYTNYHGIYVSYNSADMPSTLNLIRDHRKIDIIKYLEKRVKVSVTHWQTGYSKINKLEVHKISRILQIKSWKNTLSLSKDLNVQKKNVEIKFHL